MRQIEVVEITGAHSARPLTPLPHESLVCAAAPPPVKSEGPEVLRLATTINHWEPHVRSFVTTGWTNARGDAMNLVTESLRRNAPDIRTFENYRLRLLLHSGVQWDTRPTARIRDRHPQGLFIVDTPGLWPAELVADWRASIR